jgi:hypothetical protein
MKSKIAAGAGIELPQDNYFIPINVPTIDELVEKFNPEEDVVEKTDADKTADEIVSEVGEMMAAGKQKTPFNKLFMM